MKQTKQRATMKQVESIVDEFAEASGRVDSFEYERDGGGYVLRIAYRGVADVSRMFFDTNAEAYNYFANRLNGFEADGCRAEGEVAYSYTRPDGVRIAVLYSEFDEVTDGLHAVDVDSILDAPMEYVSEDREEIARILAGEIGGETRARVDALAWACDMRIRAEAARPIA